MRSGLTHLKKKLPDGDDKNFFEYQEARDVVFEGAREDVAPVSCDLDEPGWSVVSFDQVEAGGLTYSQAVALMSELDANDISGLCIVTDNAARKALIG